MRALLLIVAACSSEAPAAPTPAAPTPAAPAPAAPTMAAPTPAAPTPAAPTPRDDAPVTAELVRFVHREGPFQVSEVRPRGAERKAQHMVFRFHNRGTRRAGAYVYELDYFDRDGKPVRIDTRLGDAEFDGSTMLGPSLSLAPGETQEWDIDPNFGPIPQRAERAVLRFTAICELVPAGVNGFGKGTCFWTQPERDWHEALHSPP